MEISIWAVPVFALDQASKWAADSHLGYGRDITLVPGCLSLSLSYNTGIAFGLFQGQGHLMRVLAPFALCLLGYYLWKTFGRHPSCLAGPIMGLMLGGAVGNIWSRWTSGHVVDFILAYLGEYRWPTFNLADSALCVGVGLALMLLSRDSGCEADPSVEPEPQKEL